MAYLTLDDDPDLEFVFFLAEKLHRTIDEIDAMSTVEFMYWCVYFGRKAQRKDLAAKQANGRGKR